MTFCEVAIKRVYEFSQIIIYELLNTYIVNADYSSERVYLYEHFVAFAVISRILFFIYMYIMRKHVDFR